MRGDISIVDDDKDAASLRAETLHRRGLEPDRISPGDLSRKRYVHSRSRLLHSTSAPSELPTMAETAQRHMPRVLTGVGGNKTRAARVHGINRRSLYRRLEHGTSAVDGAQR